MEKKEGKKVSLTTFILVLIVMALACVLLIYLIMTGVIGNKNANKEIASTKTENESNKILEEKEENVENKVVGKSLSNFDLNFLKQENQEENKIYSPLSIKAALKMLEEGALGESKSQITKLVGDYTPTNYVANSNMAFANALFVRDTFTIKNTYVSTLRTKYNAEAISDSFKTATNVNNWVSKNTLKLIENILDGIDSGTNFILVNALGIDMDWKDKFLNLGDGRK